MLHRILGIALLGLLLSTPANACDNACLLARGIDRSIQGDLPVAASDGSIIERTWASGKRLSVLVRLSYSSMEIASGLDRTDTPGSYLERVLQTNARYATCKSPLLSDLVNIGGEVERIYVTTDDVQLVRSVVSEC